MWWAGKSQCILNNINIYTHTNISPNTLHFLNKHFNWFHRLVYLLNQGSWERWPGEKWFCLLLCLVIYLSPARLPHPLIRMLVARGSPPPTPGLAPNVQRFTWEAREQRKPLKRKAPWPRQHHGGGQRGGDSWAEKEGVRGRDREDL